MAEYPSMPLFTDAYLADTRHLTTEEHGAYLLLLMEAWRRPKCDLPDDDGLLSRLTGLPMDRWQEVKPVIMAFWKRDGRSATFRQKRLSAERDYVAGRSKVQRDNIAKRWNKKKKINTTVLPDEYQIDTPTPTPTPTPSSSLRSEEEGAAATRERENEADQLHAEVMAAVGLNGGTIPTHWLPPAATMHVQRWITDLGLTPAQVIEAARSSRAQHPEPPNGPKALDRVMRNLAATVKAPPMQPGDAGSGGSSQPLRIRARPPSQIPPRDTPESNR